MSFLQNLCDPRITYAGCGEQYNNLMILNAVLIALHIFPMFLYLPYILNRFVFWSRRQVDTLVSSQLIFGIGGLSFTVVQFFLLIGIRVSSSNPTPFIASLLILTATGTVLLGLVSTGTAYDSSLRKFGPLVPELPSFREFKVVRYSMYYLLVFIGALWAFHGVNSSLYYYSAWRSVLFSLVIVYYGFVQPYMNEKTAVTVLLAIQNNATEKNKRKEAMLLLEDWKKALRSITLIIRIQSISFSFFLSVPFIQGSNNIIIGFTCLFFITAFLAAFVAALNFFFRLTNSIRLFTRRGGIGSESKSKLKLESAIAGVEGSIKERESNHQGGGASVIQTSPMGMGSVTSGGLSSTV